MPEAVRSLPAVPKPRGIFDPVARGLDVVGDRWSLVLMRHLLKGHRGFQELRKRTGIAPRVLSSRLRQLAADGFIETVADGSRSVYALTAQGRSLEPIIVAIGRWWIQHGLADLHIDARAFDQTSAQSVLDSLPFMVNEEAARDVDLHFGIRLTGDGGGAWTVHVHDGSCEVMTGLSENPDVLYTADARVWCGVALGLIDAREVHARGKFRKQGGPEAMDRYFHQVSGPREPAEATRPEKESS